MEDFKEFVNDLEIANLNISIFSRYNNRLIDKGIEVATINSYLKDIKAMFNYLYDNDILDIKYGDKKYIKVHSLKPKPIIALTEDELSTIESYVLPFERLQRVVDLFLFGCYTALRFEDLNSFEINRDSDGARQIQINKTGQIIHIPLIPEALTILEKYNYKLPRISNQKANKYLKEAFRLFGLERQVFVKRAFVNSIESKSVKLCDTISFHKARKTFITTALRRGISKRIVMQLADIKTESIFKKYDGYENSEGNKAMNELFSRGANEPSKYSFHKILKVILDKEKNTTR